MPFTFAHPAAAAPLTRVLGRRVVLSALVIGSVVPDLATALPIGTTRFESHSLLGLFWFCLPVGILGYVWFHALAKAPLVWLMPAAIRTRLAHTRHGRFGFPLVSPASVVVSLLLGSMSHSAWDSFTHRGGLVVRSFDLFRVTVGHPWGWELPVYKLLQYGSGVLGLTVLALWTRKWLRATSPDPARSEPSSSPLWRALGAGVIVTVVAAASLLPVVHNQPRAPLSTWLPIMAPRAAIVFVGSSVVALVVYSLLWQLAVRAGTRGRLP